ncbi:MAG: NAD(P)H-hydrate dehydratase [FCB group bacterium]|nr:NAD(P)H-hydrate dehydratase [FCB group bacterium]
MTLPESRYTIQRMEKDFTRTAARALLPPRPDDGHKGTFGHVFVIGGARGYSGAVIMAALAAGRSGVGLVTVGVPRPLGDIVSGHLLTGMTRMLDATPAESIAREAVEPALEFARGKDAVVLGPGLSQHPDTQAFALEFVRRCPVPMLIDADGLNALATAVDTLKRVQAPVVLTPHPGEMARLVGGSTQDVLKDRTRTAVYFAERFGCTLVLKGRRTLVAHAGEVFANTTGNSGMATGGTGDVLSGIIGGLMAQGMAPRDAALLGVYAHGLAGDLAAADKTRRGLIATDLIDYLPLAWQRLEGDENV